MNSETTVKEDASTTVKLKGEDKTSLLTKAAKTYKHARTLVKIAGGGVLGVVVVAVALPFLGTIMLFSLAVGAVAFLVTITRSVEYIRTNTSIPVPPLNVLFARTAEAVKEKDESKRA